MQTLNIILMVASIVFGAWSERQYGWFSAFETFVASRIKHRNT